MKKILEKKVSERKAKKGTNVVVRDCQFHGVKWDGKALEAVNHVAEGLCNLTRIFMGQEVRIESMLNICFPDKEAEK